MWLEAIGLAIDREVFCCTISDNQGRLYGQQLGGKVSFFLEAKLNYVCCGAYGLSHARGFTHNFLFTQSLAWI